MKSSTMRTGKYRYVGQRIYSPLAEILRPPRKNGSDVTCEPKTCVCEDPKADDGMICSLLVDTQTVELVNRWRRERGDPELRVADFAKSTEYAS